MSSQLSPLTGSVGKMRAVRNHCNRRVLCRAAMSRSMAGWARWRDSCCVRGRGPRGRMPIQPTIPAAFLSGIWTENAFLIAALVIVSCFLASFRKCPKCYEIVGRNGYL